MELVKESLLLNASSFFGEFSAVIGGGVDDDDSNFAW